MLRQKEELEEPQLRVTEGGRGGRKHQGCDRSVVGSVESAGIRDGRSGHVTRRAEHDDGDL